MLYRVENELFEEFPAFKRGVLIATGVNNADVNTTTGCLLSTAAERAKESPTDQERVEVWNKAYLRFGSDPNKFTPSIRFLQEQIRRGKSPRSINKLVDIFNIISLKWTAPCGGDDLESLDGGDLCLGIAQGDETFAPLFKPSSIEHVNPGEVIYFTLPTRRVLCRRWTWRNSDFSKIRPETNSVAINVDMMMPPFDKADLKMALRELAELVQQFCGGVISTYILERSNPQFIITFTSNGREK